MNVTSSTRRIFSTSGFNMRSWMHSPTVIPGKNGAVSVSIAPVVFLAYDKKTEWGAERPKDNSFKMNNRNQFKVRRFFEEVLRWFSAKEYQDVFIIDEHDGSLIVNMEFRELKAMCRNSKFDNQIMVAEPAVIMLDGVQHAGISLSINRKDYTMGIIDADVEAIYAIINEFSFQQEAMLLQTISNNQEYWTDKDEIRFTNSGNIQRVRW